MKTIPQKRVTSSANFQRNSCISCNSEPSEITFELLKNATFSASQETVPEKPPRSFVPRKSFPGTFATCALQLRRLCSPVPCTLSGDRVGVPQKAGAKSVKDPLKKKYASSLIFFFCGQIWKWYSNRVRSVFPVSKD